MLSLKCFAKSRKGVSKCNETALCGHFLELLNEIILANKRHKLCTVNSVISIYVRTSVGMSKACCMGTARLMNVLNVTGRSFYISDVIRRSCGVLNVMGRSCDV